MELYYKDISPPARAVLATIKHLGLPVNIKEIDILRGENRTEEYLKLNPTHQVPTLVDNGLVLGESRAIMAYLINRYSPGNSLYPEDALSRAKIDRMLYFEASNLFPALRPSYLAPLRYKTPPSEDQLADARNAIAELMALKGKNRFMTGSECSLADISFAMTFTFMEWFFPEESERLDEWYKDVEVAVPAVKEINDSLDLQLFMEMVQLNE